MNDADCKLQQLARKVALFGRISRKGAKTQSAAAFLRVFFAPLREKNAQRSPLHLCVRLSEKPFKVRLA